MNNSDIKMKASFVEDTKYAKRYKLYSPRKVSEKAEDLYIRPKTHKLERLITLEIFFDPQKTKEDSISAESLCDVILRYDNDKTSLKNTCRYINDNDGQIIEKLYLDKTKIPGKSKPPDSIKIRVFNGNKKEINIIREEECKIKLIVQDKEIVLRNKNKKVFKKIWNKSKEGLSCSLEDLYDVDEDWISNKTGIPDNQPIYKCISKIREEIGEEYIERKRDIGYKIPQEYLGECL